MEGRTGIDAPRVGVDPLQEPAKAAVRFYRHLQRKHPELRRAFYQQAFFDHARQLRNLAGRLEATVGSDGSDGGLVRYLCQRVRETAAALESMASGFRSPFLLFVIGMGKFGKSTLVNALVGEEVAPVDFLPKTWKIDVFEGVEGRALATVRYRDGREERLDRAEAHRRIALEEARREQSEQLIEAEFRVRSSNLKTSQEKEKLKRALRDRLLYRSPIVEVRWPCPRKGILQQFAIVDTPGLWQHIGGDDSREDLRDYYYKADGVIWLLDATKLTGRQAREMLDDLDRSLQLVGARRANMVAVVNRMDLVRGSIDGEARVLQAIRHRFGDLFDDVIPMSALEAFEAVRTNNPVLEQRSGLRSLLDTLERCFAARATELQITRKTQGAHAYLAMLAQVVGEYRDRLIRDESRRTNVESAVEADLAAELPPLRASFEQALDEVVEMAKRRIATSEERLHRVRALQGEGRTAEEQRSAMRKLILNDMIGLDEINRLVNRYAAELAAIGSLIVSRRWRDSIFASSSEEYGQEPAVDHVVSGAPPVLECAPIAIAPAASDILDAVDIALKQPGWWDRLKQMLGVPLPAQQHMHRLVDAIKEGSRRRFDDCYAGVCRDVRKCLGQIREQTYARLYGPSWMTPRRLELLDDLLAACTKRFSPPQLRELLMVGGVRQL